MITLLAIGTADRVIQSYGAGWGTLSLLIAGLAQAFNRSGFGWWILGLLGGPVTLAILVLMGKESEAKS